MQSDPQPVGLVARARLGQNLQHRGADQRDIPGGIAGEATSDAVADGGGEIGVFAIEVAGAAQLEAAEMDAVHVLGEADRIGDRDDNDLALDGAGAGERVEARDQVMHHHQAGDLVGMDRRLEIGLGPRTRGAVAPGRQHALGAEPDRRQALIDALARRLGSS